MIKLLYIAKVDLAGNSGSTVHVLEICKHLSQRVVLHLIVPKPSKKLHVNRLEYLQNVRLHFLPYQTKEESPGLAKTPQIDILRFNLATFIIGLRILLTHDIDIIHERLNLFEVVGNILHILFRKPLVLEINAPLLNEQIVLGRIKRDSFIEKIASKMYHWSLSRGTKISCVSETLKEMLVQRYMIPPSNIQVIHNGVDVDFFSPQKVEKPLELADKKIVMFVGSLRPWHGVQFILQALPSIKKDIPDTFFVILGDGPQKVGLLSLCKELHIQNMVSFLGLLPHEEMVEYLNFADVLVAPYPKGEIELGYNPLKILEYMSVGKPIVSSPLPYISEVLAEECGVLIDSENTGELAKVVSRLLQDKRLSLLLGANARKRAVELFSWKKTVEKTLALYSSCLNNVTKSDSR